jgi:PPE-repeat protein
MDITLPPEITSALIHTGPGASSLIEASVAWQRLGAELENSVGGYASVLSSLIGTWSGPSSVAMVRAVEPYLLWLRTTAQQCAQTALQASAAATAFNTTRAAMVTPAQVTANRTRLAQLLATNRFGSNLPAIAATEDQYQLMWANNSAAMGRYQATSAQLSTLPQPSSPPPIANQTGTATQASVLPANTASPAVRSAVSTAANPLTSITGFDPNQGYVGLANTYANQFISSGFPINMLSYLAQNTSAQALEGVGGEIGQGLSEGESALGASLSNAVKAVGSGSAPAAALGVGVTVGKLTMPPAVVGLLPAAQTPVHLAAAASPLAAADSGLSSMPIMPMMVPPATTSAGSGWRKRKQQKFEDLDYGAQLPKTVMHRPPSGG